ncbi:hypothetical protein BJ166DRAFT_593955 [Pestalotiopsis sp. NC0098]|nr:hypothetical protein BJ166DRAFT_593955 [Pestalotiopsis sp. NC0098]
MHVEFCAKDAPRDNRFTYHPIQDYYQGAKTASIPGGFRIQSDYYDEVSVMIPSELAKYLYMSFDRKKKGDAHLEDVQTLMKNTYGSGPSILLDVTERQERRLRLQHGIPEYCSIASCIIKDVKTTQAFFSWDPTKTTLVHHTDGSMNVSFYDSDGIQIGVAFVAP